MKKQIFLGLIILLCSSFIEAQNRGEYHDLTTDSVIYDVDQLLELKNDSVLKFHCNDINRINYQNYDINRVLSNMQMDPLDSLFLNANPLLAPLVLKKNKPEVLDLSGIPSYSEIYFGKKSYDVRNPLRLKIKHSKPEDIVIEMRMQVYEKLVCNHPFLFKLREDKLPNIDELRQRRINGQPLQRVQFVDESESKNNYNRKIDVAKLRITPWIKKSTAQFQFSQNMSTANWYQGGNSTMSVLGILSGSLKYDDKKSIQWENTGEWRMGFNSVFNDSTALRSINTNEDVFKINSKLGVKAGGSWFYSGSVDFSTQFLNNYKAINSDVLKSTFLTPVRLNIGIGLDYKYKNLFSLMLAPVSYKYIYVNNITDISPNLFGIEAGQHRLSQIGSSFTAKITSYAPIRELQIDSKLSFYTNYEKVEIDWEIVGNFTVNRFLSTRLSLNPRYDNTVILPANEKAQLQFKELLSFGFTYKLID